MKFRLSNLLTISACCLLAVVIDTTNLQAQSDREQPGQCPEMRDRHTTAEGGAIDESMARAKQKAVRKCKANLRLIEGYETEERDRNRNSCLNVPGCEYANDYVEEPCKIIEVNYWGECVNGERHVCQVGSGPEEGSCEILTCNDESEGDFWEAFATGEFDFTGYICQK